MPPNLGFDRWPRRPADGTPTCAHKPGRYRTPAGRIAGKKHRGCGGQNHHVRGQLSELPVSADKEAGPEMLCAHPTTSPRGNSAQVLEPTVPRAARSSPVPVHPLLSVRASGPRWRRQPKRLPTPKKSEKHTPKALGAAPGRFASLLGHDMAASSPALPEQTCPIQSGEGATATLQRQVARVFSHYPQLASEFIDFPICKFDRERGKRSAF